MRYEQKLSLRKLRKRVAGATCGVFKKMRNGFLKEPSIVSGGNEHRPIVFERVLKRV